MVEQLCHTAGSVAALLGTSLFYLGLLPSYPRRFGIDDVTYGFAPWGFIFGCFTTMMVLLLWRPQSRVFLDRMCIHQTDPERKSAGIYSLGGFLRHSESMLVLWDTTYPTRLWTIFELAAFLKSHDASRLFFRPTILGPSTLAVSVGFVFLNFNVVLSSPSSVRDGVAYFVFAWCVCSFFVYWLCTYFRWVDDCSAQILSFSLKDAKSRCCSMEHRDEHGPLICDRVIITQCLRSWFGSEEHFEASVRDHVSAAMTRGLQCHALPFSWFFGVSIITSWIYCDLVTARLRAEAYYWAGVGLGMAFATPFAYGTLWYTISLFVAYRIRRAPHWLLSNLAGGFLVVVAGRGLQWLRVALVLVLQDDLLAVWLWAPIMALAAFWA